MIYKTVREQCLKWDRSQQCWSTLVSGSDDLVPMEVDRIDGKGWNNQYGKKGKGKGKNEKGSSKGKSKGKASQKMARKANQRQEQRKVRAKVTIDPRARENQTSNALRAGDMTTIPRIVGRISKAQILSLVMQHRQFKCAPTGVEAGLWKDKTSFWKNILGSEQNQGQGGGTCSGANKPERQ